MSDCLPRPLRQMPVFVTCLALAGTFGAIQPARAQDTAQDTAQSTQSASDATPEAPAAAPPAPIDPAAQKLADAIAQLERSGKQPVEPAVFTPVQEAADQGDATAAAAFAAYLIRMDDPKALTYLDIARKANDVASARRLAGLLWQGKFGTKEPERAIAILEDLVAKGQKDAITPLLNWLPMTRGKDGVEQAYALLDSIKDTMSAQDTALARANIFLKGPVGFEQRTEVASALALLPEDQRIGAMMRAMRSDQNLYVWLLQGRLGELGFYQGTQNGLLTSRTLESLQSFCVKQGIASTCSLGPLRGQVARAIFEAM